MTHRSGHTPAEKDAIRRLTGWLGRRFPDLSIEDLERAVYGQHHSIDNRAVHEFIPVLIEQTNRRHLVGRLLTSPRLSHGSVT
jgi:hypothetical protein